MLDVTNELVRLLVCPISRGKLIYDRENNELVSIDGSCAYPVSEGVPLILPEHARKMKDDELTKFRREIIDAES